jgi:hypothetical protein
MLSKIFDQPRADSFGAETECRSRVLRRFAIRNCLERKSNDPATVPVIGCKTKIPVKSIGGIMAEETAEQKLARLEAENRELRQQVERKPGQLRLKVSEKGGLSLYGLGRFPVTLYKEQWVRLLDHAEEIRSFLKDNDQQLKAKQ